MFATALGTVVLIITTIILPVKAPQLNSAKDIFTGVRPYNSHTPTLLSMYIGP